MAEETLDNTPVENEEEVVKSGLPSDGEEELSVEEQLSKYREEAEKYKKMHQEAEKLIGKKGNEEGLRRKADEEAVAQAELAKSKEDFLDSTLRDFVDSGMVVTEDLSTKLDELGISKEAYELQAYKYKENVTKLYNTAGGQEAYTEIMNWGKDNVQLTKEELAIVGLKALYSQEVNGSRPAPRIEGNTSTTVTNKGYTSKVEISKDLAYLRSNPNDKGAFEAYRAKLAKTPDGII